MPAPADSVAVCHTYVPHLCPYVMHRSDHTLPVTGLAVSQGGCEGASLVVSSSLDRTLKMHRSGEGERVAQRSGEGGEGCCQPGQCPTALCVLS